MGRKHGQKRIPLTTKWLYPRAEDVARRYNMSLHDLIVLYQKTKDGFEPAVCGNGDLFLPRLWVQCVLQNKSSLK